MKQTKIGTYTGAGAAINISCGFVPDWIEIINVTDGNKKWTHTPSMASPGTLFEQNSVDNATTGNSSMASATTNTISTYAGDATHAPGFTVGTLCAVNAKVYDYIAYRNAE